MFLSRTFKVFLITMVVFASATVANAYAAANVVPASKAGDGSGTIIGYTVVLTSVHYNLNASNPQNIDSVTFTTSATVPTGSTVKIKLVAAGSTWYTCTGQGSTNISCTAPGATVLAADSLRVVIAD
ncbi:MAG: hypothetical protein NTV38_04075 [Chloroflexi bacterium]|nr:hypothetical protein [Chloroflexota bacterium]